MAVTGDSYVITIIQAYLDWGGHTRHNSSRGMVYGEGYIPILARDSYSYSIYNSNYIPNYKPNKIDILGVNIFNCTSHDGFFTGELKAAGNQSDDIYAKQLQGNGDLKALGSWYAHLNAQVGDHVEVTWTSPTDIVIRHY